MIFLHSLKPHSKLWKNCCTKNLVGDLLITQYGFLVNKKPICYACRNFCHQNEEVEETLLEKNFFCMCSSLKNKECIFMNCQSYESNNTVLLPSINSILQAHAEQYYIREKGKIDQVKETVLKRTFDFAKSIKFGLQRIKMYEEEAVKTKVLSVIPLEEIEKEAEEISVSTKLAYKDSLVKILLTWFKRKFFTWCNKPICVTCKMITEDSVGVETPNEEESKWLASRTEVYKCKKCGQNSRFPRYNNPAKLCETKTGRCGEWANLFGCILRCLGYEVRFVDNFEDHVWNEYWSESHQRWIHVDSCENAWDTPLLYEQGWGRNMTYILSHSINGVYDVTRRYVKNWELIASRRKQNDIDLLNNMIGAENNILRENILPEMIEYYANRDLSEQAELLKLKNISEAEMIGRQSGSEEWRKARGEIK